MISLEERGRRRITYFSQHFGASLTKRSMVMSPAEVSSRTDMALSLFGEYSCTVSGPSRASRCSRKQVDRLDRLWTMQRTGPRAVNAEPCFPRQSQLPLGSFHAREAQAHAGCSTPTRRHSLKQRRFALCCPVDHVAPRPPPVFPSAMNAWR